LYNIEDFIGKTYGELTVLSYAGSREVGSKGSKKRYVNCICSCGSDTCVILSTLISGHTTSCGCVRKKNLRKSRITHGSSNTKLYNVWKELKRRCDVVTSKSYDYYGGRGITICDEWYEFENFRKFAENNGYVEGLSIDRIDNDLGYFPDNCRFVDAYIQTYNQRMKSTNTSGRTGVSFDSKRNKWVAYIGHLNDLLYIGNFANYEDACAAREAKEIELKGKVKK
jgi:hypothetical protein